MKLHHVDGSTTCRPIVMLAHKAGVALEPGPVRRGSGAAAARRSRAVPGRNPC